MALAARPIPGSARAWNFPGSHGQAEPWTGLYCFIPVRNGAPRAFQPQLA